MSVTADYDITEDLNLFATILYSLTEGGMQSFALQFPEGTDLTDPVLIPLYDVTAMQRVETYSDLDYQQIDVSVGGTYALSESSYLAASAGYQAFDDDQPYVYGDQDGTAYRGYLGFGHKF